MGLVRPGETSATCYLSPGTCHLPTVTCQEGDLVSCKEVWGETSVQPRVVEVLGEQVGGGVGACW